ncbi:alpha-mannosidase 2x isoform X1 [Scyliorhinus canicula]|uniref:alpha-mannosidase 2x isoform X1 n=1 Tax=Scyliorhinus canicula TaxID=7830 RepID=UPI0018F69665|nr:alpha-mannosidase 2x isoform X1 [Scyliorhinus canicula]
MRPLRPVPRSSAGPRDTRRMKLKKQITVCGGAIFCVAVFSLYLMLDRVQHDPERRQSGVSFPRSQISVLQNRIEQLEQLLEENHQIISHIKDSVLELTENAGGLPVLLAYQGNGSWALPADNHPTFLSVSPQDCQFALGNKGQKTDLQMLDVYSLLKFDNLDGGAWKQGFEITYDEHEWDSDPLQVYVVPHSHNDPGWIKTFDKYYQDQTQHILNNMLLKLQEDPKRRFIWAEISFFSKWWDNIDIQKRSAVRRLAANGQLEFVTGGWVMTDEANSHYFAMIDQLIEGHQWMEKNIGVIPKSGWAIDPFGHSSTMSYLLKRANLTSMLIQRVHYSIKKHFASTKNLEFMWRQTWDTDSNTDIFCHLMPFYSYDVPHSCGPDPKICCQFDFRRLPGGRINCPWKVPPKSINDANVEERANLLLDQYRKKSKLYRSKVVLIPLGDDFRYDNSLEWDQQFQNYAKLFDYLNSHPELHVQVQFGTLSEYFDAVYKKYGVSPGSKLPSYPVLSGDFFTYADREDHYWSGYFTSRPFYKNLDRVLESHLRAAEILYSLALNHVRRSSADSKYPISDYSSLTEARRNVGLFQHHDAITGTSKEVVVVDYGIRLFHSLMNLKRVIINAAHFLVLRDKNNYRYDQSSLFLQMDDKRQNHDALPEKVVIKLESLPRYVVVFNPIEQERPCVISVLATSPQVTVTLTDGSSLPTQISAVWKSPTDMVTDIYQISFVSRLSALGLAVFQLTESFNYRASVKSNVAIYLRSRDVTVSKKKPFSVKILESSTDDFFIENQHMQVWFNGVTGLMESIKRKDNQAKQKVQMEFVWYGTRPFKDKSGAYLFLPDGEAKAYISKQAAITRVTKGPLFSEVVSFYQHFHQIVRLYNLPGVEGLSLDVSIVVDIHDQINRELAMRLSTDIESGDTFFTDLNGFQIQPRKYFQKLPLQANFYPMSAMAYIQDDLFRLTLHTAQSLGVSSIHSGQLEVILDRRLMQDDNRGLGQGLKDNKVTCNRFRILLEKRATSNKHIGFLSRLHSMLQTLAASIFSRTSTHEVQDSRPVSFPSLLSHITSMHLSHDVLAMPVTPRPQNVPPIRTWHPLSTPIPCDFHMLNMRTLQSEVVSAPGLEMALILHRKGFDCGLEAKTLGFNCTTTQGKLSLEGLFQGLDIRSVQPMSLSLLYPTEPFNSSLVSMRPMEISTFRIRLV